MLNFNNLRNDPDLMTTLKSFEGSLKYNTINCCRIGIVDSYDENTRIAKVLIANKLTTGQDDNGVPITQNYAPIYAKVLFFGWSNIGITHPVLEGSEGILLFNDREIESWYINGNINNLAYTRAHDKTDAIFISGVLSLPNMIASLQDYLHLFYKDSFLKIGETDIKLQTTNIDEKFTAKTITGDISQTGNNTISGVTTSGGLVDTTAASGSFTSADGKLITVVNGIVKSISG